MTQHKSRRMPLMHVTLTSVAVVIACTRDVSGPPAGSGRPVRLAFVQQPTFATTGVAISPAVSVVVQDSLGVQVPGDTTAITLALGANPSGAGILAGTAVRRAVGGIATFDDLWIDRPDSDYTMVASAASLRSATSTPFSIIPAIQSVSASFFGCALTVQGSAYCTEESLISFPDSGVVSLVPGGFSFAEVSAGDYTSCGVTPSGAAYCWGGGFAYALGNGDTLDSATPVPVAGGLTFASVTAFGLHGCGVTTSGAGYCWGNGPLGDGTLQSKTPTPVSGALVFASISTYQRLTCGVTRGGTAYCWGDNQFGSLGAGSVSSNIGRTPVPVSGGLVFTSVSASDDYACGLTTTGAAYCWGQNSHSELGTTASLGQCNGRPCSDVPLPVAGGLTFAAVSAAFEHVCGLTKGGATYCWGEGPRYGPTPTLVLGVPAFTSMNAGQHQDCGVTRSGVAYCWDPFGGTPVRVRLF